MSLFTPLTSIGTPLTSIFTPLTSIFAPLTSIGTSFKSKQQLAPNSPNHPHTPRTYPAGTPNGQCAYLPILCVKNFTPITAMQNRSTTLRDRQPTSTFANSRPFLEIKDVTKVYPTKKGPFTVLDGVNLNVEQGEFICVIGHSGCGKSTLLNMVSGFNTPTTGQVLLEGQPITKPGPDRMVVFQNYALLPWRTAFENIYLAVNAVYPNKIEAEKRAIVREHLAMVGLADAMDKKPTQMSGGMRQRVSIARALAIRPKVLILDEPFGALDAITKEELQEELLKIWNENRCTVLMITHDIDEALFLADKLVMMTNGPHAKIGEVMEIPFSRPRDRARIMEDPQYYQLRNYALDFLFNRFAHDDVG
ncbi:nitrate transport ATP-binding subunits C and D [Nostoc sp. PCC 7524]|nr:nitrate transport ATP-binding subunits C and D [Nostoc sp. PCC 7524]